jgi:transcriptional regulator with GAF, ATPase, and Fis domain
MTSKFPLNQTDAFAAIAAINLTDADLDGVLTELAELAKRAIPDAAEVSITVGRDKRPATAAFTGELARLLDEKQHEHGRGPCLEAFASGGTVVINDMRAEDRWPDFTVCAVQAGCHSSMSIGLPGHESVPGALNVFATQSQAFDPYAIVVGRTIAGHAAVALANFHLSDAQATLAGHLQTVISGRTVIQPAEGAVAH